MFSVQKLNCVYFVCNRARYCPIDNNHDLNAYKVPISLSLSFFGGFVTCFALCLGPIWSKFNSPWSIKNEQKWHGNEQKRAEVQLVCNYLIAILSNRIICFLMCKTASSWMLKISQHAIYYNIQVDSGHVLKTICMQKRSMSYNIYTHTSL